MKIFRKSILFFLLVLLLGISFYSIPFILTRYKKLDFTDTVLFSIAKKITRSANSEEEKVLRLFTYVCKKINKPKRQRLSNHLYDTLTCFCKDLCNEISEFVL